MVAKWRFLLSLDWAHLLLWNDFLSACFYRQFVMASYFDESARLAGSAHHCDQSREIIGCGAMQPLLTGAEKCDPICVQSSTSETLLRENYYSTENRFESTQLVLFCLILFMSSGLLPFYLMAATVVVPVKYGKEVLSLTLPATATIGDLRLQIAERTYIPPLAQKLCGVKGPDTMALSDAGAGRVMVIGTPAQDLSLLSKTINMSAEERIQRVVWGVKYGVNRPLKDHPRPDPDALRVMQELCTQALVQLDAVEAPAGSTVRDQRRAAVAEVEQIAATLDALSVTAEV